MTDKSFVLDEHQYAFLAGLLRQRLRRSVNTDGSMVTSIRSVMKTMKISEESETASTIAFVTKGCSLHPHYQAIRRPRTDCSSCWTMYERKNT